MNVENIKNDENWLALLELYGFEKEFIQDDENEEEVCDELNRIMPLLLDPNSADDVYPPHVEQSYIDTEDYDVYDKVRTSFMDTLEPIAKHLKCEGGGEGGTEDVMGVFKMGEKYYRCNWYYQSYNGYCGAWKDGQLFDYLYEVKPRDVVVTVYD